MAVHNVRIDGVTAFIPFIRDGGKKITVSGWSERNLQWNEGDFLIINTGDQETRYKVDEMRRMSDPPDQYFADCSFAPRTTPPAGAKIERSEG